MAFRFVLCAQRRIGATVSTSDLFSCILVGSRSSADNVILLINEQWSENACNCTFSFISGQGGYLSNAGKRSKGKSHNQAESSSSSLNLYLPINERANLH